MLEQYSQQDVVIACAVLNDYQVVKPIIGKISKWEHPQLDVTLTSNIDVLSELGKLKQHQILVGFSVQNDFDLAYGQQKLVEKI